MKGTPFRNARSDTGHIQRSDFNQSTDVPLTGDDVTLIISAAIVQK
jgi:polyisoprenoid-binding protein YceI